VRLILDVGPVAHGGHCVARHEGRVVFVRHALPGERVEAVVTDERAGFLRADAVRVLTASPDRVEPPCPYARPDACGGCDFQHAAPAAQRALKAAVVAEQLRRLAGLTVDVTVAELPGGQLGWRSRVQYAVDADGRLGFHKHRSHDVVPVRRCPIAAPAIQELPLTERRWSAPAVEAVASSGGDLTVFTSRRRGGALEFLDGPRRVRERAAGRQWRIAADGFWQVHPAAAETLAATVVELLEPRPGERAWDLYGGAGLFAGALAPRLGPTGRVTVVESDARGAAAARENLADLPQVRVVRADTARALADPRWRRVDLVVVDPPRSGIGAAVARAIADRRPRAVAYVACDPAAFARDVKTFGEAGYELSALRAFDAFPMTHHVEVVGLLARGSDATPTGRGG
jgi:tRNA/tmRNA/rRNA uracil-C5-methylase (TrmA/RlmC/RlmD family)